MCEVLRKIIHFLHHFQRAQSRFISQVFQSTRALVRRAAPLTYLATAQVYLLAAKLQFLFCKKLL